MKERQPQLLFHDRTDGDNDNFVTHRELAPDAVSRLNAHAGKFVEIWFRKEDWIYQGPDEEEDHGVSERHVYGTLLEAGPESLLVEVTAGEMKYDSFSRAVIPAGKERYPYYRHQFALRRHAEISELERLDIEGETFRLGKTSGAEQDKLLA